MTMATAIDLARLGLRFQNKPFFLKPNPTTKSTSMIRICHKSLVNYNFARHNCPPRRRLTLMCSIIDQQEQEQVVKEAAASVFTKEESSLIDALIGIQGRGRSASPKQLRVI